MNAIDRRAYEGDIVSRLRNWRGLHLAHSGDLFDEAADEIDRLREAIRRLADQDATLSVCDGSVTVTMDATLTEEERWAIHDAVKAVSKELDLMDGEESSTTATLRSLLTRLK
jgi:hypothetical protein